MPFPKQKKLTLTQKNTRSCFQCPLRNRGECYIKASHSVIMHIYEFAWNGESRRRSRLDAKKKTFFLRACSEEAKKKELNNFASNLHMCRRYSTNFCKLKSQVIAQGACYKRKKSPWRVYREDRFASVQYSSVGPQHYKLQESRKSFFLLPAAAPTFLRLDLLDFIL